MLCPGKVVSNRSGKYTLGTPCLLKKKDQKKKEPELKSDDRECFRNSSRKEILEAGSLVRVLWCTVDLSWEIKGIILRLVDLFGLSTKINASPLPAPAFEILRWIVRRGNLWSPLRALW